MTIETKGLHNDKCEGLITYRPITAKICSLIASQLFYDEKDCLLQKHAALISRCMGTVPKSRFEQDWKELITTILQPGQELVGIGACIGPNDVNAAVKEALRDPHKDLDKTNTIHTSGKIVVGIICGSDIQDKTAKYILSLVSKTSCQNIDCKIIQYDEMQDIIAVLIMAKR